MTKHFIYLLLLAVLRANLRFEHCLRSCMCDCRKHEHISAICPGIYQNSPNPFPPPPTALNRREEERQSYSKSVNRSEKLCQLSRFDSKRGIQEHKSVHDFSSHCEITHVYSLLLVVNHFFAKHRHPISLSLSCK